MGSVRSGATLAVARPARASKQAGLWRGVAHLAWPTVIIVAGPMLWAIGNVIVTSLQDASFLGGGAADFVGLSNYVDLLRDSRFLDSLGRGTIFAVASVAGQLLLAVVLALLTWSDRKVMKVVTALLSVPWAVSPIVVAILWRFIYSPGNTPVSEALAALGLTQGVLASPEWVLTAVLVVNIWQFTPLYFLFVGAGLRTIDPSVLAAAQVDGADQLRIIWHIVLPQIRGLLVTLATFNILSSIGLFDLIWGMTQAGPANSTETASLYIFQMAFQRYDLGVAAAAVVVLTAVGVLLVFITSLLRERRTS